MGEIDNTDPKKRLEAIFQSLYKNDYEVESNRAEGESNVFAFQEAWCNKFQELFSFVSQYGGRISIHVESDFAAKLHHIDKYCVSVFGNGYGIEIHPPKLGEEKCRCLEHYIFDQFGNQELYLTLPEITTHISKGLARANADK